MTGEAEAAIAYGVLSLILAFYVSGRLKSFIDLQSGITGEREERDK